MFGNYLKIVLHLESKVGLELKYKKCNYRVNEKLINV